MFSSIGGLEILVILVVALLVLGPDHLPRVMRTLGRTVGELRRVSTEFQRTINTGLALEEEHTAPEKTSLSPAPPAAAPKTAAREKRTASQHRQCRIGIKKKKENIFRAVNAAANGNTGDTGGALQNARAGETPTAASRAPGANGGVSGNQKKKPYRPTGKIKPAIRKGRKRADRGAV